MLGIVLCCFVLCGCWDYKGINELDIVAGIGIDKKAGGYELTLEIVNIPSGDKKDSAKSILVETEGRTIAEALKNAGGRLSGVPYFRNLEALVISGELAKTDGIFEILDYFCQSTEFNETAAVVVAKGRARELMRAKGLDNSHISQEIRKIAESQDTDAAKNARLFKAWSSLKRADENLMLPEFRTTVNNGETVIELCGSVHCEG